MKKQLTLSLCGIVCVILFVACGSSSQNKYRAPKNTRSESSSVITSQMIEERNPLTFADAIRDMLPGVYVRTDSNGNTLVTMRGGSSLTLDNSSLIILDGAEVSFDSVNNLNIREISRIEALKEGSRYGIKGANGVLVVTTKR